MGWRRPWSLPDPVLTLAWATTSSGAPASTGPMASSGYDDLALVADVAARRPAGTTDDDHSTKLNPQLKHNTYVISSHFFPGSPEDHHGFFPLPPPWLVSEARQAKVGGKRWTCFGEAGPPNEPINEIASTPLPKVTTWPSPSRSRRARSSTSRSHRTRFVALWLR